MNPKLDIKVFRMSVYVTALDGIRLIFEAIYLVFIFKMWIDIILGIIYYHKFMGSFIYYFYEGAHILDVVIVLLNIACIALRIIYQLDPARSSFTISLDYYQDMSSVAGSYNLFVQVSSIVSTHIFNLFYIWMCTIFSIFLLL